jgi:hypothetical protein
MVNGYAILRRKYSHDYHHDHYGVAPAIFFIPLILLNFFNHLTQSVYLLTIYESLEIWRLLGFHS